MSAALTRYAYLGPSGTFTEQALRMVPEAADAELVPMVTVPEALRAVRDGEADAALVPLENSVEGAVPPTLDGLVSGKPLMINREVLLPVTFNLYAAPGADLGSLKNVASHPHGLAQCQGWLREHVPAAELVASSSTADAAEGVVRGDWDAAVCAPVAGQRHGLVELAVNVADNAAAVTRFVLVTLPGRPPAPTGADVTSLVAFIAHDRTGALLEVLTEFAVRGINLTRIESRPTKERMGRYCFFLDCDGHIEDARVGEALMGLRRVCADVRFLGSYPRAGADHEGDGRAEPSDDDFADAAAWLDRVRVGGA
ncbi:prephenate dehydratase [Cryptosporangium aurantiacum]|uniref:Prephenate dehydratase n=1 Tax=Cryptosporangium aurantiacum TaxID=134849 RepID=A0A1M7RNP4_9ACTN|nr:prephenate dehydratase [Cryptosporangium aurantiacum]SHN47955.1 prephenate dehydratase [Cryptosporangium aurantiacum]